MNLFNIIPDNFFKPLTSKYKTNYIDCLRLIYNTYKSELSFGVDKEIVISELGFEWRIVKKQRLI